MSKTRDTGFLGNVVKVDSTGNVSFVSGSTTLMSISSSGAVTTTGVISGSNALSSSYALNADQVDGLNSTSFVFTSSYNTDSGSFSTRTTNLETASGSFSTRVTRIEGNYATTGSNVFLGAQTVCANITSTGTIIAQTLNVQQVTSSVVYSSGSNVFGNLSSDVQQMTGSLRVTGSGVHYIQGGCTGIGTASPADRLHVSGGNLIVGGCFFSGDPDGLRIFSGHWATGNTNCYLVIQAGGGNASFGTPQGWGGTASIYTCNQTRLKIDTNGIACFSCQVCTPLLRVQTAGGEAEAIRHSNATVNNWSIGTDASCNAFFQTFEAAKCLILSTGGSGAARLTINGSGNVSIAGDLALTPNDSAITFSSGAGRFFTGGAERMRITSGGISCFACRVCAPSLTIAGTIVTTASPGAYEACINYLGTTYSFGAGETGDTVDFKICGASSSTTGNRFGFWTQAGNATPVERLRIDKNGIACFACTVCAPRAILSDCVTIGVSTATLSDVALEVYRAAVASNWAPRLVVRDQNYASFLGIYNQRAGVFAHTAALNGWHCLYINTIDGTAGSGNNGAVIFPGAQITSAGIACFACQVCAPLHVGNVRGQATIKKAVGSMNGGGSSQLIYLTSNIQADYGINDYSISVFAAGNSAEQSSLRALAAYGYYASSVTTTELAKFLSSPDAHSQLSFGVCKLGSSNTYCYAVFFAKSSGTISGYCVTVTFNGITAGGAGDASTY